MKERYEVLCKPDQVEGTEEGTFLFKSERRSSFGLDNTDLKTLASANKVEVRIDNLAYTRKNLAELTIKGTETGISEFKRMVSKMLQVKEMGQCNLETSSSRCTRPKYRYIHENNEKNYSTANYSTANIKNKTYSNSNIEGYKSDREKENNKVTVVLGF